MISHFFQSKSAPGVLLCLAAILAMLMENSPFHELYDSFKNIPAVFQVGGFIIDKPLLLWINDGLMAIFFLLIGMEIKRELVEGHLSKREQIILPAFAALGGLIVPALLYASVNWNNPATFQGWAIPAATDIAFALGVLVMLGSRIPTSLKVTLVALATIDDLAAIVIIALFYTAETSIVSLALAGAGLLVAYIINRRGVMDLGPYILLGFFIWACVLKSGVHATLAGVALGLLIPLGGKGDSERSPLKELEHTLHPFVAFCVLPIFAFVNAGVSLSGISWESFFEPITLGIILGLFAGKQIGVMVFTFIAVSLKLCTLPRDVTWMQFYGMALLTGIGFTMSLFIGTLAFTGIEYTSAVRLGVLGASALSAIAGISVLLLSTTKKEDCKG